MQPPLLSRRIVYNPSQGSKASFTRTFTEADMALFIGVTWDINPYHTDDAFAAQTHFRRRIIPGLLTASLLTHMGGLWAFLATSMQITFKGPVYVGDTITAEMEVVEMDPARNWVRLKARCINAGGEEVLQGEVSGHPGRFEEEQDV
jgi:3-hydroxybutyryl-CoA dehydratase